MGSTPTRRAKRKKHIMTDSTIQCDHKMVWVQKYSDLEVPELGDDGVPTNEIEYVDVNFYRCSLCGLIHVDSN